MDTRRLPPSVTRLAAPSGGSEARHNTKTRTAINSQQYHRLNPRTPILGNHFLTNGEVKFPPRRLQENLNYVSDVNERPNLSRPHPFMQESAGRVQSKLLMTCADQQQTNFRTQLDTRNHVQTALHTNANSIIKQSHVKNGLSKDKAFDDYRKFRDDVPSRPALSLGRRLDKGSINASDVTTKIALFEREQSHNSYDIGRSSFVRNTSKRPRLRKRSSRGAKPSENFRGYPEEQSVALRPPYPGVWPDGGQGQFVQNNAGAVPAKLYSEAQSSAYSAYHNALNDRFQGPVYRPIVALDYQIPEVVVDRRRSSSLGDILEGVSDIYDVPYGHTHPDDWCPPVSANSNISTNLATRVYATCLYNESRTNVHEGKAKPRGVRTCDKELLDHVPSSYSDSQFGSFHEVGLPYSNFAQVSLSTKSGPTVVNELSFLTHMPMGDHNSSASRRSRSNFNPVEPSLDKSRFVYRAPIPRLNNGRPYGAPTSGRDYRPSEDYVAVPNNNLMPSKHDSYNSPLFAQTKSYEVPKYTIASNVSSRRNVDSYLEKELKAPDIFYQNRLSMSDPDITTNLGDNLTDNIDDRRVTDNKAHGNHGRHRHLSKPEPVAKLRKGSVPQITSNDVGKHHRATPGEVERHGVYRHDTSSFNSSTSHEDSKSKGRDVVKVVLGWQKKRSQKPRELSSTSDSSECAKHGSDSGVNSSRRSDLSVKKSLSRSLQNLTARLGLRTSEKSKTTGGKSQLPNFVIYDRRVSSDVAYRESRNGRLASRRQSENVFIDRNPTRYRDYQNHVANSIGITATANKPDSSSFPTYQGESGNNHSSSPYTDEILAFVRPQSPEARKQRSISFDHHLLGTSDLRGVSPTMKKGDQPWRELADPVVSDSCKNLEPMCQNGASKTRMDRSRHDGRTDLRNHKFTERSGLAVHRYSKTSQSSEDKVGPLRSQSSSSSYDRPNAQQLPRVGRSAVKNSRLEEWESNQATNAVKDEHPQPNKRHLIREVNVRRVSVPTSENDSKGNVSPKIPTASEPCARNNKSPRRQRQPVPFNSNVASLARIRETEFKSLKSQPPKHHSTATSHANIPQDLGRVRNTIPPNAEIPREIFHESIESTIGSSLTDDYKQANQLRAVSKYMYNSESGHEIVHHIAGEQKSSYISLKTRPPRRTEQSTFYSVEPSDIGVPLEARKTSLSFNGEEQNITTMRGRAMSDIEALLHTYVARPSHFVNKDSVTCLTQNWDISTVRNPSPTKELRTDVNNCQSRRNGLADMTSTGLGIGREKPNLTLVGQPDRHEESKLHHNANLNIHLPNSNDCSQLEVLAASSDISDPNSKHTIKRRQNCDFFPDVSRVSAYEKSPTEVRSDANLSSLSASKPVAVPSSVVHRSDALIGNDIDSVSVYEGCSGNCTNNIHNYSKRRSNSLLVNYSTDCFMNELDSSDHDESERISGGTQRKFSTRKIECKTGVVYRRQSDAFANTSNYEASSKNSVSQATRSPTTETNSVLSSQDGCSSCTDSSLADDGRLSNPKLDKVKPMRHRKSGLTAELTVQAIANGSRLSEGKRLGSSTFYVEGFPDESVSDSDKADFVQSDVPLDNLGRGNTKKEPSSPSLSSKRRDGKQSVPGSIPGSPFSKHKRSEAKRARKLSDYLYSKMFNGCNNPSSSSFSSSDSDAKFSDQILIPGSLDRSTAVDSLVADSRKSSHESSSYSNSPRLSVLSNLLASPTSTLQREKTLSHNHPSVEQDFAVELTGTPMKNTHDNKIRSSEVKPGSTNKSPSIFARVASKFNKSGKYSSDSSEDHSGSFAKKALKYNTPTPLSVESQSRGFTKSHFAGNKAVGSKLSTFYSTPSDHRENNHDDAESYDYLPTPKSSKKDASHLVLDFDLHNTTPRSRRHSKRQNQGNKSVTLPWSRNQRKSQNVAHSGSYSPRSEEIGLAYTLQKRLEESLRVSSDMEDSDGYEDCSSPSPTRRLSQKSAAPRRRPLKNVNGRRVSGSKATVKRLKPGSKRRSIYRRGARRWRKLYKVNGHIYQAKRFNRRASCAICQDRIWGLGRQGFKCTQCKLLVHKKCSKLQTRPCTSEHFDTSTDTVLSHDTTATTGSLASNDRPGSMAAAAVGGGHHRNRSSMSTLPAGDHLSTGGGLAAAAQQQQAAANSKAALMQEEAIEAAGGDTEGTEEVAVEMPPGECVSPSPATTGQYSLADFELLRVIGRGSYAKVLMVELKRTGRIYAMKVIKKTLVTDDEDIDWVQTEKHVFETASNHPFLVGLHSCFQTPARLFFVIEFVRGGDLMFHMQRQRRLHEEHARFYAAEICLALNFLHEKGIIYRDLKLDNVLLDHEGHIKLTDYGMCKEGIRPGDTTSTFCGTPNYIAPEILQGVEYSFSVDWWALGVLLYEMLAGKSPFDIVGANDNPDFNTEDFLFQVILERPIRIPRSLSVKAASILKGFLNKNPSDRLGCHPETGFTDIISHPFFRTIDWELLEQRQVPPPHRPRLEGDRDLANFPPEFTDEPIQLTPDQQRDIDNIDQSEFEGFEYVNPLLMSMEDCV